MSLIKKIFGGKNTADADNSVNTVNTENAGNVSALAGCTSTEESAKIYAFAKANASKENTEKIFRIEDKPSYYLSSETEKVFENRIIDFGFDNPMELEQYLKELWKNEPKMQELIPVIKVAVFANRDKYDSKYKDLSLYNYTL